MLYTVMRVFTLPPYYVFLMKVDPNGILSFQSPASFSPVPFPALGITAIALFWMEVEFSRLENIYYRETSEWCLLERAHEQVKETFTSAQSFFPTALFIATWQVYPPLGTSEVHIRRNFFHKACVHVEKSCK